LVIETRDNQIIAILFVKISSVTWALKRSSFSFKLLLKISIEIGSGECVFAKTVCDGERDCSDGEDEENCLDYVAMFVKESGFKVHLYLLFRHLVITLNCVFKYALPCLLQCALEI